MMTDESVKVVLLGDLEGFSNSIHLQEAFEKTWSSIRGFVKEIKFIENREALKEIVISFRIVALIQMHPSDIAESSSSVETAFSFHLFTNLKSPLKIFNSHRIITLILID